MLKSILEASDRRSAHDPDEWLAALRADGCTAQQQAELRIKLKQLDSGRFHRMLDEVHRVLYSCDLDQYQAFRENYSDWLFKWVQVYGYCEDLNTFEQREK